MSTRALWKVLEAAFDHPNADGDVCRAARDELQAIEKAARVLSADATIHAIESKDEGAVEEAENLLFGISEGIQPKT